jgi:hypothetical protein
LDPAIAIRGVPERERLGLKIDHREVETRFAVTDRKNRRVRSRYNDRKHWMRFQKTPHFHHTKLQLLLKLTRVTPLLDRVLKYVEDFLDVKNRETEERMRRRIGLSGG